MGTKRLLDQNLLKRVAQKTGKSEKYIREQVSKKASQNRITAPVELISWAKELGFGTQRAMKSLSGDDRLILSGMQTRPGFSETRVIKVREPVEKSQTEYSPVLAWFKDLIAKTIGEIFKVLKGG